MKQLKYNIMTKQEFLAFSLPYGLQGTVKGKSNISGEFIYTLHNVPSKCATVEVIGESNFYTDIDKFRPILHPLSNLTKEIEHNEEKFVPIVKLAELINPYRKWRLSSGGLYAIAEDRSMDFEYDYGYNCFLLDNFAQLDQFKLFQKLIEWHFDLADLISKGEAIDVNTLDINPYK